MDNIPYIPRPLHSILPRTLRGPPPTITNTRSSDFTFPPSTSLLESLFPHNPIISAVISYLTTPALLSLYCTCRTLRYYLHGQRRYFRSLLLVPDAEAERWEEPPGKKPAVKRSAVADRFAFWTKKLRDFADKEVCWIDPSERKKIVNGHLWGLVKGHPLLPVFLGVTEFDWVVWLSMVKSRDQRMCFAGLMSRHLYAILTTIPVGRRLTTLVLDGTGVETDYMQYLLPQIEGTLRGLSVKGCPHIECYIWAQWLLEALQQTRPVALEWLSIWGSGNTPTTDFDFTIPPLPLEPLDPHPDDPVTDIDDWSPSPSLFANVLSVDFHLRHTVPLMPAMSNTLVERRAYMARLRNVITRQYQRYLDTRTREGLTYWNAPAFPLGDPHPVIALLAVSKYLSITLDIAFCASRHDCYSFLHGRSIWENINGSSPQHADVTILNEATGVSWTMQTHISPDGSAPLHTHCVAEIRGRRETGAPFCQNCGLWEDELSPEEFRGEGTVREYAGITWGTGIGLGRLAVGNCCTDCVRELTCYGCNAFYCPSCCFLALPQADTRLNPLAAEPVGTRFLHWTCAMHRHGPYCNICMEEQEHFFACIDCGCHMCYKCHGPGGTTVSCALYTENGWDEAHESTRFGVVGDVGDWELGAYFGWGGAGERFPVEEREGVGGEMESECGDDAQTELQLQRAVSDCCSELSEGLEELDDPPTHLLPRMNEAPSQGPRPHESDPEHWPHYIPQLTSHNALQSALAVEYTDHHIPYIDDAGFYSDDLSDGISDVGSGADHDWVGRLNRMSETRIWEVCERCKVGTCAGCLGYEEDMVEPGHEHERRADPEYRRCSGGCGMRFCDECLNMCGGSAVDWVCGGIDDGKRPVMAGMPGAGPNGGRGGKGRCGAVMCLRCQAVQLMVAPTVGSVWDDLECDGEGAGSGVEAKRRWNGRRGVWMCSRCELGMPLV